jgi:glycosyltransferase involved in cell wall biosynthesis
MGSSDIVCLSHLRWDFVYQRPNHLMERFARTRRVFFVEEPIFTEVSSPPRLEVERRERGLRVVRMHLPPGRDLLQDLVDEARLFDELLAQETAESPLLWYYTPMPLRFTRHVKASARVYDCMDQLSLFHGADASLCALERELLSRVDIVFTGGHSLYEDKATLHANVHPFPSSVDVQHFARTPEGPEPDDQSALGQPRVGFYGVIDERTDLALLDEVARARPAYQWIMVGPVVKIDERTLPRHPNLHYLGAKSYGELPRYLARWDVAMMPFARNDATKFISPTKTLEYLAAGKPVVSTPIRDVVRPYGERGIVRIAADARSFAAAVDGALAEPAESVREKARETLAQTSWDKTFHAMNRELVRLTASKRRPAPVVDSSASLTLGK